VTHDLIFHLKRLGATITVTIRRTDIPDLTEEQFGINPIGEVPLIVDVDKEKPAGKIGLQPGDTILAVNGIPSAPVCFPNSFTQIKAKKFSLLGCAVNRR